MYIVPIFIESSLPLPLGISDHTLYLFGLCSLISLVLGISSFVAAKKTNVQDQIQNHDHSKWLYGAFAILILIFLFLYFFSDWFVQKGIFGLGGH